MKKSQKNKPSFKIALIATACICVFQSDVVLAQTAPSSADVLRNIEQNKIDFNRSLPKPAALQENSSVHTVEGFSRLKEVRVNSPMYPQELMAYWNSEIDKPVSTQKLSDFQAFAWNLFQRKGYLAYITSSTESTPDGTVLTVNASFPIVGKVFVVTTEGSKGKEFADEVTRRFSAIYKSGATVDVLGFENQLNAATFDLPVDLEVSMRQTSSSVVDVVIHLRPVEAQTGKVLGGVLQINNYGLEQFGRMQLLGNVRIGGVTPLSELTLTTQQSTGVGYYRADYEAPVIATGLRWKVYGSDVRSQSISTHGLSQEFGGGLTKLLSTDRTGRWLATAEVSRRQTQNWTAGVVTANRVDQQLRLKLRAESSKSWVDNFNNELILTTGYINLDRFDNDKTYDASTLKVAGTYQKLEMNGGLSHTLDKHGIYTGSIRWRAQAASNNLDGYNKISLGGINGMRSYSSIDGVGDQGAQLSFDLTHQVVPDVWGGLFYDIGTVKNDHRPLLSSTTSSAYLLQGAGMQFGGTIDKTQWTLSMALAIGKKPSTWTAANTQPGDMRINFAITKPF
ncbi:MAG: ShlB/FhaC/HecB family hemolysin secretion/activation protein [Limnohabitans sp.]